MATSSSSIPEQTLSTMASSLERSRSTMDSGKYSQLPRALANMPSVQISFSDLEFAEDVGDRTIVLEHPHYEITVGRGNPSDSAIAPKKDNLFFTSKVVSRNHAIISADPITKKVFIRDTGSMHGTYVGSTRITKHRYEIKEHEIITFGQQVIRGVDTFEPLRLSPSWMWPRSVLERKATGENESRNNIFTISYSDDESEVDISDEEPQFVSSKRVSAVVELAEEESMFEPVKTSSIEASPQSKKSVNLVDSPPTSTSSEHAIEKDAELSEDDAESETEIPSMHVYKQLAPEAEISSHVQDDDSSSGSDFGGDEQRVEADSTDEEEEDELNEPTIQQAEQPTLKNLFAVYGQPTIPPSPLYTHFTQMTNSEASKSRPPVPTRISQPYNPSLRRPLDNWCGTTFRAPNVLDNPSPYMSRTYPQSNTYNNPEMVSMPNYRRQSPSDVAMPAPNFSNFNPTIPLPIPQNVLLSSLSDASYGFEGMTDRFRQEPGNGQQSTCASNPFSLSPATSPYPINPDSSKWKYQSPHQPTISKDDIIAVDMNDQVNLNKNIKLNSDASRSSKRKLDDVLDMAATTSKAPVNMNKTIHDTQADAESQIISSLSHKDVASPVSKADNPIAKALNKRGAASDKIASEAVFEGEDEIIDGKLYKRAFAYETEWKVFDPTPETKSADSAIVNESTTIAHNEVIDEEPPRKRVRFDEAKPSKQSLTKSIVKNTAIVLTSAAFGAVGTVLTLANLPAGYFA